MINGDSIDCFHGTESKYLIGDRSTQPIQESFDDDSIRDNELGSTKLSDATTPSGNVLLNTVTALQVAELCVQSRT